ncbi:hypothetical protein H2200_008664 [Cladophialophora chaetospira]|uniref:GA4 desaturase n=1 Tax=Cladophialophora chaetospira TaxID=386627 RepID=A0AA39CFR6_9EURO|nr:hypothetical protein H2200_008664 [Cladophialophora chaetospira]
MSITTTYTDTLPPTLQDGREEPIEAEFLYWASKRENDPSEAVAMVNGQCEAMARTILPVYNIRPNLASVNHESHGFQIVENESTFLQRYGSDFDFSDFKSVHAQHSQDVIALVKEELSVRSAVVLNNVFRESSPELHDNGSVRPPGVSKETNPSKPFHIVHNDYSLPGANISLRAMVPSFFEDTGTVDIFTKEERDRFFRLRDEILSAQEDAIAESGASSHQTWNGANYRGPRWGHFSIWRPIEPVQQDPLAVLDPNSLFANISLHDEEHKPYMRARLLLRSRQGFLPEFEYRNMMPLLPRDNQSHRWLWLKDQQPNEVNFLKLFDSEAWKEGSRVMPCAPHSAFSLPNTAHLPPRRSIETRVLVVW